MGTRNLKRKKLLQLTLYLNALKSSVFHKLLNLLDNVVVDSVASGLSCPLQSILSGLMRVEKMVQVFADFVSKVKHPW